MLDQFTLWYLMGTSFATEDELSTRTKMDFSSLNPLSSNALCLAARKNDVHTVRRLLKKMNPNLIDNRGWTCLHEAATHDCYESLKLILQHPDCRPLTETHEGHTALYLACRHRSSDKVIKCLLESAKDIANYSSTELVSPLHIASALGDVTVVQLLIDYGAMLNVQDFDGDTPLHDAALASQFSSIEILLHAGADPSIRNEASYTPFHLACCKGCYKTVISLYPFVLDINESTSNGDTPLMLALQGCNDDIIDFLLENGADPHRRNMYDELALHMALMMGYNSIFRKLLDVTDRDKINRDIVHMACKPHYFKLEILEELLKYNLGPEFFEFVEPFHVTLEQIGNLRPTYLTSAPLNSYLNICEYIYNHSPGKFMEFFYLFLQQGVSVNALDINECPPLVYLHYTAHNACFSEVFKILTEHDCNVDHCSSAVCLHKDKCIPDAFLASLTSNPMTIPIMLPFSLRCEPGYLLNFACKNGILHRMPPQVITQLLTLIDCEEGITAETLPNSLPTLKHLSRLHVRKAFRDSAAGVTNTKQFLNIINNLELPVSIKNYLRYQEF